MAEKLLSEKLHELASKARSLEHERSQAAASTRALEPQVDELGALIAQASAKLDRMLKEAATDHVSQPRTAETPEEPTGFGGWPTSPLIPERLLEERFRRAFNIE